MKYGFAQIVGNKVIALQVFLAPKQDIKSLISVKPEDWDGYVQEAKDAADDKAKGITDPIRIDVQINHGTDSIQEMSFDDLKQVIFGTAE